MSLPSFSVKNHVLVNMMMLVILVGGAVFAVTLVREMFPESRPDKLSILAVYLGVQPEEIEKAVTIKVEEAIRDVEGIEKVESTVSEGISMTIVTLLSEVDDVDIVLQAVKNEIDSIENLPDDLEKITVRKIEPKLPVISVALFGEGDEADLKRAVRSLRDDLLLLPGVSDVQINGIRDDEISVEILPEKLLEYDITFEEVASAIRVTNLDVSGGELKGNRQRISVRTLGEESRGVDLEDIVIRSEPDGRRILLSHVSRIRDQFVESDLESYFNGRQSASCVVYKTKSQDAIQISTLVKAFVAGKKGEDYDPYDFNSAYSQPWYWKPFALIGANASQLVSNIVSKIGNRPDPMAIYEQSRRSPFDHSFSVALHSDLARFVEGRLDLLTRNGRVGLVLVLLSLMMFLNFRVAFWAAVGLPVSFLGSFIVMWIFGVTINLLTMFGLIVVLGIIVDDAIVIGENIFRHIEEGLPPMEAAVKGAEEVMWPVTIAVVTTIASFSPLLFIRGQIGDFMGQLPIVVLAALSVSLIEALLILPAHLSRLPSKKEREERQAARRASGVSSRVTIGFRRAKERMLHGRLTDLYERFLRVALRWRYVSVAAAASLFIVSLGFWKGGIVETVFIQKMDSETIICALEMPVGTTADNVKEQINFLANYAVENMPNEVVNVQTFIARQFDFSGFGSPMMNNQSHLGQMVIELKPADEREKLNARSSEELLTVFRKVSQKLAGVNSVTWEAMSGGPGGKDIHIKITGSDFDELVEVAEELKSKIAGYQGVFDLDDDIDKGKREIQLQLRESARPTGITVSILGSHVRAAMFGAEAHRLTRNREDVKIMVRYPQSVRKNIYNIESMWIPTSGPPGLRGWVPLGQVAKLTETEGYSTIHRSQQQRSVSVFGEVDQAVGNVSEILEKVRETFDNTLISEHPNVRIEFLGSYEEMGKAFGSLRIAFPVALLMIYMLLAGLFRSYFQPLVVMSAIPFSLMGAIIGHWVTGNPMTILSGIGMVALTGIVVNDSLILVDFVNTRVRDGMSHFEASIQGSKLRLRAILLTTLTTVAGLTPLMFETSFQAKFLIPMAVTLTFGLIFATALTLVLVPTLNMIYFDLQKLFQRRAD
jgi:HAE1 family hydrophobic/amphiphilic exporter-1